VVTVAEAQEVVARQKSLVANMAWTTRRGKVDWAWFEARILLRYSEEVEVAEQLWVMCQWRKKGITIPEHWKFALFYREQRIYAIDVQPTSIHENDKAGKGHPLYLQEIDGIHEHTWSAEGYGYAEPISVPLKQPEVIWRMFLKRANIDVGDFHHPDNDEPELI
jgi:hypothetical protein